VAGTLHVVGTGPGDPELMTLKAARVIAAAPVVAWFAKRGRQGHARRIADAHIGPAARQLRFEYPYTTEIAVDDPAYEPALTGFYVEAAAVLADRLAAGEDVALLCEGDPFFFGSAMYLFDRLRGRFATAVVPGVTAMSGCWAQAALPMTHGDDVLTVLPGTLPTAELARRLRDTDAAVVMKVGSNLGRIRAAVDAAGLTARATLVERGTMAEQRIAALADAPSATAYFSLVLVPGRQRPR
jgi:precorrin-2/cobalt-factor-2 C20-methyltransferase